MGHYCHDLDWWFLCALCVCRGALEKLAVVS